MQRKSLLIPLLSRLSPRTISMPVSERRTPRVVGKIERIAPLDAEKVVVDPALIAVVATHNLHARVRAAHAQGCLASVPTVRADCGYVVHLPRPRLVAVSARRERPDRTDVDTHAALFTLEVIVLVGRDDRTDAAILYAQGPHVHALAAHANAAITKDASRPVKVHHRRPLLLLAMVLGLREFRFQIGRAHV